MSAEVSCITLLWHFEFASPVAVRSGSSDLNTSSQRSGDKESEPSLGAAKSHKKGHKTSTLNTGVCMLGCVWSLDGGICVCMSGGAYAYMPAKVHLGVCTFACVVCLPRGRGSRLLIIHQQRPYMSIPEPLSPQILIHYWEALPEENRPERKLDTPTSWAAPLINSSSTTFFLAASLSMNTVHIKVTLCHCKINKQIWRESKVRYENMLLQTSFF